MRKLTGKMIAGAVIVSMALPMLTGCDFIGNLFGGKTKEAITTAASGYIDAVIAGSTKESKRYVTDKEDAFQEFTASSANHQAIIDAVLAKTTYEFVDVEGNAKKGTGSADVVFTIPDLDEIMDEDGADDYSLEDLIAVIEDTDLLTEEEFTFDMEYDDDEWFVDPDSTEDFCDFIYDIGEDIELSLISPSGAMALIDQYMSLVAQGDYNGAIVLTDEPDYYDGEYLSEILTSVGAFFEAYYSAIDYTLEVTDSTENNVTVNMSGTRPDGAGYFDSISDDPDKMAPFYAELILDYMGNDGSMSSLGIIFDIFAEDMDIIPTESFSCDIDVYAREDGTPVIDALDIFETIFNLDMNIFLDNSDNQTAVRAGLDLLLEQGRITQEQYNDYLGVSSSVDDNGITISYITGDEFYNFDYTLTPEALIIHPRTWGYYDPENVFEYDIKVNGTPVVTRAAYNPGTTSTDNIYISYELPDGILSAGEYIFTVYDEGAGSTDILIEVTFAVPEDVDANDADMVIPDPAPTAATGESLTIDEGESNDLYTYDFLSSLSDTYNAVDGYSAGDEGIYIHIVTWDYYDYGDQFVYDIYKDGQLILPSQTASISDYGTDDLFLKYVPDGGLEAGNYTFVLYDHGASTVHSTAYATVE